MWLVLSSLIVLSTVVTPRAASSAEGEHLQGAPFTDPATRLAMPKAWVEQPVRYEEWAQGADLAITLDQHLYRAFLEDIRQFALERKINIAVKEGTCGISAGELRDKSVDVGGFCCPAGAEDRLPGLKYHTLGIGAIAILVNAGNPIDGLSLSEARDVFEGNIVHWRQLSPTSPAGSYIRPIGRLHCKNRPGHWRLLLDDEDLFSARLLEVNTIADMLTEVARNPDAIGYEVLWMIEHHKRQQQVKALLLNGVAPTDVRQIAAGRYPLYRTFNVTTWEGPLGNPHASALVEYLKRKVASLDPRYGIISADRLRGQGWVFEGDELIGEPR